MNGVVVGSLVAEEKGVEGKRKTSRAVMGGKEAVAVRSYLLT